MSQSCTSWYAIRVQSKCEYSVSRALSGKGYEEFLPLYRVRRRWSDRQREMEVPLFPGYLFCRFCLQNRLLPMLTTPGLLNIVGAGKTPIPIDDAEIAAIKAAIGSGIMPQPWPFLGAGDRVYVEKGPLAGVEGIVASTDKGLRLIISVSLLQRSIALSIDRDWVRPVAVGNAGNKQVSKTD